MLPHSQVLVGTHFFVTRVCLQGGFSLLVLMKNFKHTQNRRMNSHIAIMQIEQLLRLCHVCFNCFPSFFWSILKQIHKISSHFSPNTYAYISKTIDIFLNNSMSLSQLTIRINNSLVSSNTPLYSEFPQFSQKIFSPTFCLLPPNKKARGTRVSPGLW